MASVNKVILIGNVTRDPEVRYTPKGTALVDLGLAVNRQYSTEGGEKMEETTFVDVTFWGRQAEVLGQYIQKGRPIYIEGRLQLDSWQDEKSGQKRSRLKVIGDNFQFLGSGSPRDGDSSQQRPTARSQSPRPAPSRPKPVEPNDAFDSSGDDDDIPF